MKNYKYLFIAACALMGTCCVSCYQPKESAELESRQISFEQFSVTESLMGRDVIPASRATQADAVQIDHLLVLDVMNGDVVQTVERHDDTTHAALSEPVTLNMDFGTHDVYFLCAVNPWASFSSSELSLTWNAQTSLLNDVWVKHLTLTVDAKTAGNQSVVMDRCVSYIRVVMEDALPANLSTIDVQLVGGSWTYNLAEGAGGTASTVGRLVNVPNNLLGQTGVSTGFFTFVPKNATTAEKLTLVAKNASNQVISSAEVSQVPINVNRYTIFSGSFFSANQGISLSVNSGWDDPVYVSQ